MNARHLFLVLLLIIWPVTACGGSDPGTGSAGSDTAAEGDDSTSTPTDDATGDPTGDDAQSTDDDVQSPGDPDATADAIGPDAPPVEPEPEPIALDSSSVHPAVEANLTDAGERLQEAFEWLKATETLGCIFEEDEDEVETGDPGDPEPGDGEDIEDEEDEPFSVLELFEDLTDFLLEDVMTTVESADGETVLYAVDLITLFCEEEEDGVESIDADCADSLDDVDAQIRVVSYAEGELDLAIVVNGHEPAIISLHGDDHAVHLDLPSVRSAWDAIKEGFVDDEDGSYPLELDALSGLVDVSIDLTEGTPIQVHVVATTDIAIEGKVDGDAVNVDLPASQLSVNLDQVADLIDVGGALAHLQASVAGELITKIIGDGCDDEEDEPLPPGEEPEPCVPNELTGMFAVDLAGLSASALLDDTQAHIAVQDLTLGGDTTTLTREGVTVLSVDLNAALNWTVSLTLSLCGDAPQLAVDPALDISAMFAMAPLSATFPDLEGSWMEDDTLGITLSGTDPLVSFDPLQVVSGTLAMSSASRPDLDQSITAGQCFQLTEDEEELPDELLSAPCGEHGAFETVYTGWQEDGQGMRWTFPHFDDGAALTPPPGQSDDRFHVLEGGSGAKWCGNQCASWTDWTCAGFLYKYWGSHGTSDPAKEWSDGDCILLEKLEAQPTEMSNILSTQMSDPNNCPAETDEHIFDEMAVVDCEE